MKEQDTNEDGSNQAYELYVCLQKLLAEFCEDNDDGLHLMSLTRGMGMVLNDIAEQIEKEEGEDYDIRASIVANMARVIFYKKTWAGH